MRALLACRLLLLVVGLGLCATFTGTSQAAAGASSRVADEIFEINVRPAGCTTSPERLAERMVVSEYALSGEGNSRQWVESDLARVTQPKTDAITIFFVHGNKVDACYARQRSMRVYRTLVRQACDDRPIRFVIFSWPAAEVNGFLNDFRVKAARTRPVGWQLAWVLNQMPGDARVSLLGYSYGARIVGGAMHVLAGGDLSGLSLGGTATTHRPMRVAFLAAATHAGWFGPNCYHGLAMHQIDRLLLLNNELDPAMRFYRFVETNSNPQAMGLCGPTCLSAEARSRVECYDCSRCVGRSHDLFKYMATGRTITRVWEHLTYAD